MLTQDTVWLITGCSSGFGRALAQQLLEVGYRTVVTARDATTVADIVKGRNAISLALDLDVTNPEHVRSAVETAERRFGKVAVLVNNAGYGYLAAIEEGNESDVHDLFETNVYGMWRMIKAVLPGMRQRRRGHIVNMSSVGGITTFPAVGFYHMAKFAVEGLSETLAKEIATFGVGVTVVEPGAFRTDFRGRSMRQSSTRLADYAATAGKARDNVAAAHGRQSGDPVRGANAIIKALEAECPPLHLVIGGDALDLIRAKITDLCHDLDTWEAVTRGTDFTG